MNVSRNIGSVPLTDELQASINHMLRCAGVESSREMLSLPDEIQLGQNLLDGLQPAAAARLRNGHLSIGLPPDGFCNPVVERQLEFDLFWFPAGIPIGHSVGVASSRLGKKLDMHDSWFDAIRTTATRLDPQSHFLITGNATTTDDFVMRIGQLFGFSVVRFLPVGAGESTLPPIYQPGCSLSVGVDLRPCYVARISCQPKRGREIETDSIDQLLIRHASEVRLLSVRSGGNIIAAARRRLADSPDVKTKLLVDSALTSNKVKSELLSLGATAWWLYRDPNQQQSSSDQSDRAESESHPVRRTFHPLRPGWKFRSWSCPRFRPSGTCFTGPGDALGRGRDNRSTSILMI